MGRFMLLAALGAAVLFPASYQHLSLSRVSSLISCIESNIRNAPIEELLPPYSTQLLSTDPLLISISDFISLREANHLIDLGTPLFRRSMITDGKVTSRRTSDSCFLPSNDSIVSSIKQRAAHFLGGIPFDDIEAVQLIRYAKNQRVDLHYNWHQGRLPKSRKFRKEFNRLASFFVYVDTGCTGGET
jgi:prolyl 4-hydroxylase